jgi:hypothetical protein
VVTSLPAGVSATPASGALPGLKSRPVGTKPYEFKGSTWCFPPGDVVRVPPDNRVPLQTVHLMIKGGSLGKVVHLDTPKLAVPVGTVTWYDAVVAAGWTDAAPTLPPLADQFNQATHGKG